MRIIYPFNMKEPRPLYEANENGYGGFYPVGKNRFWHGGIHLSDPVRPVTALADGEIIAYRVTREALPYEPPENRGEPYSNNFVLMRHNLTLGEKTYTFYSLYMHLLPLSQYSPTQKAGAPPIFRQKEYFVATRRDGAGLRLRSAERKEEILCVIPKGAVVERLEAADLDLCWPIEQQRAAFTPVCYQDLTGYAWLEGRSERLPDGRFRITTTEDRPAPEEMGLSIHERASDRSPVIAILPHGSHIPLRTKPKTGQQDFFPLEGEGYVNICPQTVEARDVISPVEYDEVVNLNPPVKVLAGEVLGYGGPYKKSNKSLVHLEIFTGDDTLLPALKDESRKRGKNCWQSFQEIAESGGYSKDGLCDVDKLLAMIDRNRDGQIETEEMRTAFDTSANELRRLVCCHPTEWSEGGDREKWRRLKEPPWSFSDDVYQATLAHIRNMQFWDEVKGLPDPKRVWHFHPVAFVEEMKRMYPRLRFPLDFYPSQSYKKGMRKFGASRANGRKHAGCDLYAEEGTPIYAMADGNVLQIYEFYKKTWAVEVDHGVFLARYCEISKVGLGIRVGSEISKGQLLAFVGKMKLVGGQASMLHIEIYSSKSEGPLTNRDNVPYQRREDLLDPTLFLDQAIIPEEEIR